MRLPSRLKSIVQFIPPGTIVADVGTDHAMLPVYLVREGIAKRVVAGDLHCGPLKAARKNVTEAGLAGRIILRQGYGLEIVKPGERTGRADPVGSDEPPAVDVAVIAGMGGTTIRSIIETAGDDAFRLKQLVLQPMADSGHLREWLVDHGWRIAAEDIVKEDGILYQVISAVPGVEETVDRTLVSVGPRLFEKMHPLLIEVLIGEIQKHKQAASDMAKSASDTSALKRKELLERIDKLEWVVECLLNARL